MLSIPKRTGFYADPTARSESFDIIGDALSAVRVKGSVLLRESYVSPWGVDVPAGAGLAVQAGTPTGARAVAFHMVEFGHCRIHSPGLGGLSLVAGDVAVCFGGLPHSLSDGSGQAMRPLEDILARPNDREGLGEEARSPAVSLLCGLFFLMAADLSPILGSMPPLTKVSLAGSGGGSSLGGVARLLTEEVSRASPGGPFIIARLLEAFCAEVIRSFAFQGDAPDVPWVRAARDPIVSKALSAFHAAPGKPWSVTLLAAEANLSPSRFAARFSTLLGEGPMSYVSNWRMVLARRMLAGSEDSMAKISDRLGYESQAAFNRAFRKIVGASPSAWRNSAREAA
jgi:AraC-like DNA-binding protein